MSVYNDLLNAAQAVLSDLGFTWGTTLTPVNAVIAQQPVNRETLDGPLPVLVLSPGGPEQVENAATGGYVNVVYKIDVTVIGPGEGDVATNLAIYLAWRETLRRAFQRWKPSTVPTLWYMQILPGEVFDKEIAKEDYALCLLTLECISFEQAVNT